MDWKFGGAIIDFDVFSFDDDSETYLFSVFRDGERVQGEKEIPGPQREDQKAVLEAFVGLSFKALQNVAMERFDD